MKNIVDFIKPRFSLVFLSILLLGWQYFYSYSQYNEGVLKTLRGYLSVSANAIDWGSTVTKAVSLGLVWISVALAIFLLLLATESTLIFFHNQKVKSKYANQSKEDFAHLLRNRKINYQKHLPALLLSSGAFLIIWLSLFWGADSLESARSIALEEYSFGRQIGVGSADFNASVPQILSFLVCYSVWYLVACFFGFLFRLAEKIRRSRLLAKEHFGPIAEN